MRAALLQRWPELSAVYGLRPWDTGRLTPAEMRAYLDRLPELLSARR